MNHKWEPLTEASLREKLGNAGDVLVRVFSETDSTNRQAKQLALEGFDGFAVLAAERQTAGRGRLGRSFYSPEGSGAYFSFLYSTVHPLENAVTVTGAASVAVMRAIRRLTGRQAAIKWVNDLYLDGKKVCGILTEAVADPTDSTRHHIVVGIGVNWHPAAFPTELSAIAGSVGAVDISRASLIAAVWRELEPYIRDPGDRGWLGDYRICSAVIGKEILWIENGTSFTGMALGIDDDGGLIVERSTGERETLRTGEISVRLREG